MVFNNKINMLKALAIMIIVSGHLEFSLIPFFPPYSYHLALFFFISGYLFNEEYLDRVQDFIIKRIKSLLVPYVFYTAFYLGITLLIAKLTGKFWGMDINLKNFILTPFLNGHQLDLSCPLWFVTQLFVSMIFFVFIYRRLKLFKDNKWLHLSVFWAITLFSMPLAEYRNDPYVLLCVRTMFSLFFIYLGLFFRKNIEGKINIFTPKWIGAVLLLQGVLWHTNKDFTPADGVGLSYILVWGEFDDFLIPVLTSLTGIWASLFVVEVFYHFVKDNKFVYQMGQNTYHIMANHLFIMYLITVAILYFKGIGIEQKNLHDIYWIYCPIKTTYFYFFVTMIASTYIGVGLKFLNKKFNSFLRKLDNEG